MLENDANHLVFLDESGVNTDMTRHYVKCYNKVVTEVANKI